MKVTELFRRLSFGELSNLAMGSDGTGEIRESDQNKIIHYTNEALLRLYSRFILSENGVIVVLRASETNYKLIKRFAQTSDDIITVDQRFIYDDPEQPFQNDVIRITNVTTSEGAELPLNDVNHPYSVFTPQPDTLQVPMPEEGRALGIVYQARHPELQYDNLEAEIDLPVMLEGALTAYIAHLTFFHMNGQENSAKAVQYLATYDAICREVEAQDLVNAGTLATSWKFFNRGWI